MYQKPFGSIFGDDSVPKKEDEAPPPPSVEEEHAELLAAKEAVAFESLPAPKRPFTREEPQFRAASTVVSHDPQVLLSQAELSVHKSQIKYASLLRAISDMQNKIGAAKTFLVVLAELQSLPDFKQKEIANFIAANEKKLKKLVEAQQANTLSKEVKEATAALDVEIRHWEKLNEQKGKVTLKNFRPKGLKTSEELPITSVIPKIQGKVPMDKIVHMRKDGVVTATGYGDAEPDQVISSRPKKDEYYIKFMSELPTQGFYSKQRSKYFVEQTSEKKTEKKLLLSKQYDWKSIQQLEPKLTELVSVLETLQKEIAQKSAGSNPKVVSGLSALVMTYPTQFAEGALLDNLRATTASITLNGFGDAPAVAQAATQELATREAVLTDLQQQLLTPQPTAQPLAVKPKSIVGLLIAVGLLLILLRSK